MDFKELGCSHALLIPLPGALPGVGFLARPDYIAEHRGTSERICGGVFYAGHDGWQQLGVQALGAVVIIVFTGACRCAAGLCGHLQVEHCLLLLKQRMRRRRNQLWELCGSRQLAQCFLEAARLEVAANVLPCNP